MILTVLLFWISFFLPKLVFVLQWLSLHWEILVFIDFPSNWQWDAPFHHIAYDYSRADCDGLHDYCFVGNNLCASVATSEFCEWVQVGIDVYILHRKYQVKSRSSLWYSADCAAAIIHRNHFFLCTKMINLILN